MNSKRLLFPVGAALLLMCSIGSPSSAPAITIEFIELPPRDIVNVKTSGIDNCGAVIHAPCIKALDAFQPEFASIHMYVSSMVFREGSLNGGNTAIAELIKPSGEVSDRVTLAISGGTGDSSLNFLTINFESFGKAEDSPGALIQLSESFRTGVGNLQMPVGLPADLKIFAQSEAGDKAPEPSTGLLLGLGTVTWLVWGLRRTRSAAA